LVEQNYRCRGCECQPTQKLQRNAAAASRFAAPAETDSEQRTLDATGRGQASTRFKLVIHPGVDGAFDVPSGRCPIFRQSAQILRSARFSKMRDLLTLELAKQIRHTPHDWVYQHLRDLTLTLNVFVRWSKADMPPARFNLFEP
jgi:hypothetical protein